MAGRAVSVIVFQLGDEPGEDNADFHSEYYLFVTGKVDLLLLIDGVEFGVTELARLRSDNIESFNIMKQDGPSFEKK